MFQYIICVGSSFIYYLIFSNCPFVSIHHMCRFKLLGDIHSCSLNRFNTSYVSVQVVGRHSFMFSQPFQYIICVGSRKYNIYAIISNIQVSIHHMCRFKLLGDIHSCSLNRFNTSYVSVQESIIFML